MTTVEPKWSESRCAQYEFSLEIEASRERVWRGLTDQIGAWWLPDFHMLGPDSVVTLEPFAGGRLYEQAGDRFLLWYTVLEITPGSSLELAGYCTARYGGPATTMLSFELTSDSPNRTKLRFSDSLFGRVTDGFVRSIDSGWQLLFTDGLKRFVE